ncbi:MAG: hypothetical protein ACHP6I_01445 [Rickettsiales bacterium]
MTIFKNECLTLKELALANSFELRNLLKDHTAEEVMEYYRADIRSSAIYEVKKSYHAQNAYDDFKHALSNIAIEKGFKPTSIEIIEKLDSQHITLFLDSLTQNEFRNIITDSSTFQRVIEKNKKTFAEKAQGYLNSLSASELDELLSDKTAIKNFKEFFNLELLARINLLSLDDFGKTLITSSNFRILISHEKYSVESKITEYFNSLSQEQQLAVLTDVNFRPLLSYYSKEAEVLAIKAINNFSVSEIWQMSSAANSSDNALYTSFQRLSPESIKAKLVVYLSSCDLADILEMFRVDNYLDHYSLIFSRLENQANLVNTFDELLESFVHSYTLKHYGHSLENLENKLLEYLNDSENQATYIEKFKDFDKKHDDVYHLNSPILINRLKELEALSIGDAVQFLAQSANTGEADALILSYVKSGELDLAAPIPDAQSYLNNMTIADALILFGKLSLLTRITNECAIEIKIQPKAIFLKFFEIHAYALIPTYSDRLELVTDFWQYLDKSLLQSQLEFDGLTGSQIAFKFAILDLFREYVIESNELNSYERAIFNPTEEVCLNLSHVDLLLATPKNSLGISYLDLAILVGKNVLASELLEMGFAAKNYEQGFSSLDFLVLNYKPYDSSADLIKAILQSDSINVDQQDGYGQTPADMFLRSHDIKDLVLARSKDKIYEVSKGNYDSIDETRTNIAISIGDGFWSSMSFAVARKLATHNNVDFYLVNMQAVEATNDAIFSKFDAWLNPGAGDSYPKDENGFNLDAWTPSQDIEKMHFKALEQTDNLHIPYLGICAGAQHLSLYHGSNVKPVNLSASSRDIILKLGSLPHFMTLSSAEQKQALTSCVNNVPKFKGDTAHSFALDENNVAASINVGAVSETAIPMFYSHENGIRFGKQFHAEHYYSSTPDAKTMPQKEILNNFVSLAKMHHAYRVEGAPHPEQIMQAIASRLAECVEHVYFTPFADTCPKTSEDVAKLEEYIEMYF